MDNEEEEEEEYTIAKVDESTYIRAGIVEPAQFLQHVTRTRLVGPRHSRRLRPQHRFFNQLIYIDSLRYLVFQAKGIVCVKCGREGEFFAIELHRFGNSKRHHANLYAVDPNGTEIMMTIDHIHPKSKGGSNNIGNLQPMCSPCNQKKDDHTDEAE